MSEHRVCPVHGREERGLNDCRDEERPQERPQPCGRFNRYEYSSCCDTCGFYFNDHSEEART